MIRIAIERNPLLEFFEGDAEDLNFDSKSFDAVTMNFGMLHMSNPGKVFSEAGRLLKEEGRFGFTIWAKPDINPGARIINDAVNKFGDLNITLPEAPSSFLYSDPAECLKAFQSAGFNPDSMKFFTANAEWKVPTSSFFFEAELNAGVRTSALLKKQSDEALRKIKSYTEKEVEKLNMKMDL